MGQWIVDLSWVTESMKQGHFVQESGFELAGDLSTQDPDGKGSGAPRAGRLRAEMLGERILENWRVYLHGEFASCKRSDLKELLSLAGAIVVDQLPQTPAFLLGGGGSRRRKSRTDMAMPRSFVVVTDQHPQCDEAFDTQCRALRIASVSPSWVFDTVSYASPRPLEAPYTYDMSS